MEQVRFDTMQLVLGILIGIMIVQISASVSHAGFILYRWILSNMTLFWLTLGLSLVCMVFLVLRMVLEMMRFVVLGVRKPSHTDPQRGKNSMCKLATMALVGLVAVDESIYNLIMMDMTLFWLAFATVWFAIMFFVVRFLAGALGLLQRDPFQSKPRLKRRQSESSYPVTAQAV